MRAIATCRPGKETGFRYSFAVLPRRGEILFAHALFVSKGLGAMTLVRVVKTAHGATAEGLLNWVVECLRILVAEV